jgi:ParB family chromosome partitioning protein
MEPPRKRYVEPVPRVIIFSKETAKMAETTADVRTSVFQSIPIDQIRPSRHQARKDFDEEGIKELAVSIDKEGLLQPITVRQVGDGYELIAGERRLRAVKSLGHPTIEARVIEVISEAASCAKGLVENLQRKDLNPIEEAEGFRELGQLDPAHWTQEQIAMVAGKKQGYVSDSLRLLGMPAEILENIRRRILSRSHGLELMRLSPEKQVEVSKQVISKDLSRGETRKLVDGMVGGGKDTKSPAPTPGQVADLAWKGKEIAINRHFKPTEESLQDYLTWLTPALQAFVEAKPARKYGHLKEVATPPANAAVVEKMVRPVKEAEESLKDTFKPRLPANAAEETELADLAAKDGPKAVYTWIYGADSPMTQAVPFNTWEEASTTPADGLKQLLEGIRKFQGQ